MRRDRRRQGDGRPRQDGRTSVVTPHSQVLDACRGSGRPLTDPDPRTRLQILKPISCSYSKDFSDRDPVSVVNNIGIRATCSRKYWLERGHWANYKSSLLSKLASPVISTFWLTFPLHAHHPSHTLCPTPARFPFETCFKSPNTSLKSYEPLPVTPSLRHHDYYSSVLPYCKKSNKVSFAWSIGLLGVSFFFFFFRNWQPTSQDCEPTSNPCPSDNITHRCEYSLRFNGVTYHNGLDIGH